jgi:hypothetical protein
MANLIYIQGCLTLSVSEEYFWFRRLLRYAAYNFTNWATGTSSTSKIIYTAFHKVAPQVWAKWRIFHTHTKTSHIPITHLNTRAIYYYSVSITLSSRGRGLMDWQIITLSFKPHNNLVVHLGYQVFGALHEGMIEETRNTYIILLGKPLGGCNLKDHRTDNI